MRGSSIAIHIPRAQYFYSHNPEVQIKGTAESIPRLDPKDKLQRSKDYIRTSTPQSSHIYTSVYNNNYPNYPSTPIYTVHSPTSTKSTRNKRDFRIKTSTKSPKVSHSASPSNLLNRRKTVVSKYPLTKLSAFDKYVREIEVKGLDKEEEALFPEELNEKLMYLPDNFEYPRLSQNIFKKREMVRKVNKSYREINALSQILKGENRWRKEVEPGAIFRNRVIEVKRREKKV